MSSVATTIQLPSAIPPELSHAARALVDNADRIAIFGHQHPDCDAVGSALGLAHALRGLGKHPVVAVPDGPSLDFAPFLPGFETVVNDLSEPPFDLLIALDAGDLSRYGDLYPRHQHLFANTPILNIDHHVTSTGCGIVNIIDPSAAATAELLTLWLTQENIPITEDAAKCLLAGVITDTRSFEFDATTARTLLVGAFLRERGAIPQAIIKPIYRLKTLESARIFGLATATIATDMDGKLIWSEVTPAMWDAVGVPHGTHDDGVSGFMVDVIGVEIAAFFRLVAPDTVRVSIRTSGNYDATAITTRFNGGGHPRAAGCTVHANLDRVKHEVLQVARELLSKSTD